jgi:outer membrane protein TolC
MGVSGDSQFTLTGSLEPLPDGEVSVSDQAESDVTSDLATARQLRPELLGAKQRLESAKRGNAAANGASKFQASLVGMADVNQSRGTGSGGLSVGVVIGIPLSDGGLRRAGRDEANATVAKAQAELDRIGIQIEREVRSAQITLIAAQQNVATAQTALAASEEGYRVATLRYEGGRATNAEVLDSLAALTRARSNRMKALFEAQTALDQKMRALGQ